MKIKNKILISILLFISTFIIGVQSFAGIDPTVVGTILPKSDRKFQDESVETMRKWVADNKDKWLGDVEFNINGNIKENDIVRKALGSELKVNGANPDHKYAYCIDPNNTASTSGKQERQVQYIIDVKPLDNENKLVDTTVYGCPDHVKTGDNIKQYKVTNTDMKGYLALSYIAYNAMRESSGNADGKTYKIAFYNYLWTYRNQFDNIIKEPYWYGISYDWMKRKSEIIQAKEYGKKIADMEFEDATNIDTLKNKTKNNKTYLGPYRITYAGENNKIDNIVVKTTNTGNLEQCKVATSVGGNEKNTDKIKSGEKFYIVLDGKVSNDNITEIVVKSTEYDVYKSRMALLSGSGSEACQNYIIYLAKKDKSKIRIELPVPNGTEEKELLLYKVGINEKGEEENLAGVGFKLEHLDQGYVIKSATGEISYTKDKTKATEFITKSNGKSDAIKNLATGKYRFIETKNPNSGYEWNENVTTQIFEYKGKNGTETFKIKNNKKTTIDVKIIKKGVDNYGNSELLDNVGFKLFSKERGYVIERKEKSKVDYTWDINLATEFFTNRAGECEIKNLDVGKYKFIETTMPWLEYKQNKGKKIDIEFTETQRTVTVENEKTYGKLNICKNGINDDGTSEPLNDVKFTLKHSMAGYVKEDNGKISYTPYESEATEFKTGEEGRPGWTKEINNLLLGTYIIKETENNNDGFTENVGTTFTHKVTEEPSTAYCTLNNPTDDTGKLRIIKYGDSTKLLPGVKFTVKNNDKGYVCFNGGKIDYTPYETGAYEFETGKQNPSNINFVNISQGEIYIEGLKVGDYTLHETYNPNKPYKEYPNLIFTEDMNNRSIVVESNAYWNEYEFNNYAPRGNLKIIKIDEVTKEPLKDVTFTIESKDGFGYVQSREESVKYTSDPNFAERYRTDDSGIAKIEGLLVGDYTIHEIENENDGYERYPNKTFDATVTENNGDTISWDEYEYGNPPQRGKITIVKKVEGTNVPMGGIGFILEHKEKGFVSSSGTKAEYSDNRDDAEVFYTATEGNDKGKATIEGLLVGEYNIYEVENDYYGFEINPDKPLGDSVTLSSKDNNLEVEVVRENKQKYIKLRGYVWEDIGAGKETRPNGYYDGEPDIRMNGIPVYLKEGDTIIADTLTYHNEETDADGVYEFTDIEVDKLGNYYIEFEYDGLKYTNVVADIRKDNGSKAAEPTEERRKLNEKFATIERGDNSDRQYGVTKDKPGDNGTPILDLKYNYADHQAKIDQISKAGEEVNPWTGPEENQTVITANTNETSYSIREEYDRLKQTQIVEWIDNINLGIYQREQPDIALVKDIQNVRLTINGYEHTYEYANRFNHPNEYTDGSGDSNMFNVGVKFGTDYGKKKYTRPIYQSDYTWNSPDKSKELEVYITYKIQLKNEASSVRTIVNSIVDYYDSNYGEYVVGKGVDANRGTVTDYITDIKEENSQGKYKKLTINTNADLAPHSSQDIYIQFKIDRGKVAELLKDKKEGELSDEDKLLDNIVEINSYSPRDKDSTPENVKYYAGIDKDSAPGNIDISNTDTWEDDTDKAPALQLQVANGAREISGIVFEDKTNDGLHTGKIREGNGEYLVSDNDRPLIGVQVKLAGIDGDTGREYLVEGARNEETSITKSDGSFVIKGFIPGNYKIIYTWGENKGGLDVQDYKGTIFVDKNRHTTIEQSNIASETNNSENIENKNSSVYKWYKEDNDYNKKRYSDAIDNYNDNNNPSSRMQIDEELKTKTYSSQITPNLTMNSLTPKMKIGVEYDNRAFEEYSDKAENQYKYQIKNIDFGIVRRAKQSVELDKRVKSMKVTLANGQVISEVEVKEDRSGLDGNNQKHVTYMGPLKTTPTNSPGFVKVELDNELLQGSKVEVIYEFKFKNKSEIDIMDEDYYKYGTRVMNSGDYILENTNGDAVGTVFKTKIVTIRPTSIVDYLDRNWGYEQERNTNWDALTKEQFENTMRNTLIAEAVFGNNSSINDRIILTTKKWRTKDDTSYNNNRYVYPKDEVITLLEVSKTLTTTDEISLRNETEITQLDKPGGATIIEEVTPGTPTRITPGSHIPGQSPEELDTDESETVIVIPSTGANLAFVIPITVAIIALVILGTGIVLIKKKVIDIKK